MIDPKTLSAEERALLDILIATGRYQHYENALSAAGPMIQSRRALFGESATEKCAHKWKYKKCMKCGARVNPDPYGEIASPPETELLPEGMEPASEGAKVETTADRIAADLAAGTFRGAQPKPAPPSEMPEAVRRAIQCLRETNAGIVHSLGVDGKVAEDLERKWRTHAAPLKVAMSPDLEDLLDSIMSFADVDPDTQVKQIWRRKVAAVRAQAAGVKLPKVRGLLSKLQYGHSISAQYKKEIAAALAELDAVEGVETKEGK